MARPSKSYDVWFLSAEIVYKGVPFQVVADWVTAGRLSSQDRVRPAGESSWILIADHELLAPYLSVPADSQRITSGEAGISPSDTRPITDAEEVDAEEFRLRRAGWHEEDDPDMIPLIDISLVLLIFFMMIRAAGALSPVDVPDMQFAGELSKSPNTITIAIEKRTPTEVVYSVRVGENPPTEEFSSLPTPEAAILALDRYLQEAQQPPDVRIACAKDLPNERVYELVRELKPRKARNLINSYDAEVNEKAKP